MSEQRLLEKLAFESLRKIIDELPKTEIMGTASTIIRHSPGMISLALHQQAVKIADLKDALQKKYNVESAEASHIIMNYVIDGLLDFQERGGSVYYVFVHYIHTVSPEKEPVRVGREAIGIGAVMAEVAWLGSWPNSPPKEKDLIEWLTRRYYISEEDALRAIKMAERCGVIERAAVVRLKHRDDPLIR